VGGSVKSQKIIIDYYTCSRQIFELTVGQKRVTCVVLEKLRFSFNLSAVVSSSFRVMAVDVGKTHSVPLQIK
jgi:hypothetical protein